jgi:hypothetical protein
MDLSEQQLRAYARFITARNKVGLVRAKGYTKNPWIPTRDVLYCVEVTGLNHPVYVLNEDWQEYKEASLAWWAIEPLFRDQQRMRATRGDYGSQDNWDDVTTKARDVCSIINQEDVA